MRVKKKKKPEASAVTNVFPHSVSVREQCMFSHVKLHSKERHFYLNVTVRSDQKEDTNFTDVPQSHQILRLSREVYGEKRLLLKILRLNVLGKNTKSPAIATRSNNSPCFVPVHTSRIRVGNSLFNV